MRVSSFLGIVVLALAGATLSVGAQTPPTSALPVIVLETVKGVVEIELFETDAPKSVAHILNLVRKNFYRGQRIHRVTASLVQFGDPQSRNMTLREHWGSSGSGTPINAFETSKRRLHVRGAVGLAHSGNPMGADSQLYIMKTPSPGLDGKHAILGRVVAGMAVADKLQVTDMIKSSVVKGAARVFEAPARQAPK